MNSHVLLRFQDYCIYFEEVAGLLLYLKKIKGGDVIVGSRKWVFIVEEGGRKWCCETIGRSVGYRAKRLGSTNEYVECIHEINDIEDFRRSMKPTFPNEHLYKMRCTYEISYYKSLAQLIPDTYTIYTPSLGLGIAVLDWGREQEGS